MWVKLYDMKNEWTLQVTSSSLDQYFYTAPPAPKSEKKPEAYVFNFNKGSAPTIYIQSKP